MNSKIFLRSLGKTLYFPNKEPNYSKNVLLQLELITRAVKKLPVLVTRQWIKTKFSFQGLHLDKMHKSKKENQSKTNQRMRFRYSKSNKVWEKWPLIKQK